MSDEAPDEILEEQEELLENEPQPEEPEPAPEEPEPAPKAARSRRSHIEPVSVRLYHDEDGYHFVGIDSSGKVVKGTESAATYGTVQMAKRGARAVFPTLPIR